MGENTLKPSFSVKVGDRLGVKKNGFDLEFEIVKLLEKRVSSPIAVECYLDHTTEEERNKYKDWFIGKGRPEFRERGSGRPTKRDRRDLSEFKANLYEDPD